MSSHCGDRFAAAVLRPQLVHGLAVACLVAVSMSASAATVTWNVGDGVWDFSAPSWANGAVFADGDTAVFSGSQTANRSRVNAITIDAAGVSPAAVQATGGYAARFTFSGGDILTGSITTTTSENTIGFYRSGSYSFGGGITSASLITYQPTLTAPNQTLQLGTNTITTAGLQFFPTQSGTKLNNTINLTGGLFWSNANVDWSQTTVNVTGAAAVNLGEASGVNSGIPFVTNNLTMTLTNNATFLMNTRSQTGFSVPPAFTAVVTGSQVMTASVGTGYQGYSIIDGAGNWGIAGLTKTGSGVLRVLAPEVVGDVLRIDSGKIWIGTNDAQTVNELWLGGVQQTALGTYGATGSGADFINDTYFGTSGGYAGVVLVVPEPASGGLALAAGTLVALLGRRVRRG